MISIAPMLDISNHHFRAFVRLLTRKAVLYTEMKSADAVIHSHQKILPFHQSQHPIILQIGGCDGHKLAEAARIGEAYGYDGINLNVGCPSGKVRMGEFGAVLMKSPQKVKEIMAEITHSVAVPCSVKCRLGVDDCDSFEFLKDFVSIVRTAPVNHFIIHARKALLNGLKPAKNLTVPPLNHDRVFELKQVFPQLCIQLNGGIKDIGHGFSLIKEHKLQGLMVGRLAIENPFELTRIDNIESPLQQLSESAVLEKKLQVMLKYVEYIESLQRGEVTDSIGNPIHNTTMFTLVKPFINFYNGAKYSRAFRRQLSDLTKIKQANFTEVIRSLALRMADPSACLSEGEMEQRLVDFD